MRTIFISMSLLRLLLPGCHHNRYCYTSSTYVYESRSTLTSDPPLVVSHRSQCSAGGDQGRERVDDGITHTNLIYVDSTVLHPHHLS